MPDDTARTFETYALVIQARDQTDWYNCSSKGDRRWVKLHTLSGGALYAVIRWMANHHTEYTPFKRLKQYSYACNRFHNLRTRRARVTTVMDTWDRWADGANGSFNSDDD
jgi:hypothetical protein